MIRLLCVILALASSLQADTYLFLLNRFGGIEIETAPASVRFFQGNKQGVETVYQSELMVKSPYVFLTPSRVRFEIEKLSKPVIHDPNRRINSGTYKLHIIGNNEVLAKIPHLADFAVSDIDDQMVFYGEKVKK